jgi:hypothetical protein
LLDVAGALDAEDSDFAGEADAAAGVDDESEDDDDDDDPPSLCAGRLSLR